MTATSEDLRTGVEPTFRPAPQSAAGPRSRFPGPARRPPAEHGDHLLEVGLQLIKGVPLAVSAGESRDVAHKQARVRTALDDGGKGTHSLCCLQVIHRRQPTRSVRGSDGGHGIAAGLLLHQCHPPSHPSQDSPIPPPRQRTWPGGSWDAHGGQAKPWRWRRRPPPRTSPGSRGPSSGGADASG